MPKVQTGKSKLSYSPSSLHNTNNLSDPTIGYNEIIDFRDCLRKNLIMLLIWIGYGFDIHTFDETNANEEELSVGVGKIKVIDTSVTIVLEMECHKFTMRCDP